MFGLNRDLCFFSMGKNKTGILKHYVSLQKTVHIQKQSVNGAKCLSLLSVYRFYFEIFQIKQFSIFRPRRGIWSDVFPLALQQEEAYLSCVDWFKKDLKFPPLLRNRVQPCPCILDQALLDGVRFQPDPNCNMFSQQTGNCLYRKDAKHCVHLLSFGCVFKTKLVKQIIAEY